MAEGPVTAKTVTGDKNFLSQNIHWAKNAT